MTPLAELAHIPSGAAYFCENCKAIGNSSTQCPACADASSLVPVSNFLDRPADQPSDYPECDKLIKVAPVSNKIGEFLDWLAEEKGWRLAVHHEHDESCRGICGYRKDELQMVSVFPEKILAEFFEIDLDKVEEERCALLVALRGEEGL